MFLDALHLQSINTGIEQLSFKRNERASWWIKKQ